MLTIIYKCNMKRVGCQVFFKFIYRAADLTYNLQWPISEFGCFPRAGPPAGGSYENYRHGAGLLHGAGRRALHPITYAGADLNAGHKPGTLAAAMGLYRAKRNGRRLPRRYAPRKDILFRCFVANSAYSFLNGSSSQAPARTVQGSVKTFKNNLLSLII
jgi:hypothetical protein